MGNENGVWIMRGMEKNDPRRARTAEQLIGQIEAAGFLPLFRNGIPGFSVEERTLASDWWTGDPERDPWEWRELLARSGRLASYVMSIASSFTSSLNAFVPVFSSLRIATLC